MKTERRHELQENELANWLGDRIRLIAPYSKAVLALIVLGLVAVLLLNYASGRRGKAQAVAWTAYLDAESSRDTAGADAERFEQVAEAFPDTVAAQWALLTAADLRLDESLRAMFLDRKLAQDELAAARELYEQLVAAQADTLVQQRAMFGLAKCLETQGDFDQATRQYEQTVANWSGSQIAVLAAERLEALKRPETRQWYNWFAQQQPVASPLNEPGLFQDLPNLPEAPDLKIPTPGELFGPSRSTTGEAEGVPGSTSTPAATTEDSTSEGIELPLLPELDLNQPATGQGTDATGGSESGTDDEPVKLELDLPPSDESPAQ